MEIDKIKEELDDIDENIEVIPFDPQSVVE